MLKKGHSTTENKAVLYYRRTSYSHRKIWCHLQTGISSFHPWFPTPHAASCCSCQISKVWKQPKNDVTNWIPLFHWYHCFHHNWVPGITGQIRAIQKMNSLPFLLLASFLPSALYQVSRTCNFTVIITYIILFVSHVLTSFLPIPEESIPNVQLQSQNCHLKIAQLPIKHILRKLWKNLQPGLSSKCNFQPPFARQHPSSGWKLAGASAGALSCRAC